MNSKNVSALISIILLGSAWSGVTSAASPDPSCWTGCFYDDPGQPFVSKHSICFQTGKTWSETANNWTGHWFQDGERVRWYGHTKAGNPTLATAGFGQFSSANVIAGEYAEWNVPGSSNTRNLSFVMFRSPTAQCP
jgi:hypothetical protein